MALIRDALALHRELNTLGLSRVTLGTLREQVSKLAQFPFFMKDTIRENVRLARQEASYAEVEEACRLAHAHTVIVDPAKVPHGYDTMVDVQVPSGGQKRLIALARCLLRKPEVLLLDEPTENLEEGTHEKLLAAGGLYTKLYEAQNVDPALVRTAR